VTAVSRGSKNPLFVIVFAYNPILGQSLTFRFPFQVPFDRGLMDRRISQKNRLRSTLVAALCWLCLPLAAHGAYVGSDTCIDCHQAEYADWIGSHHQLAMAEAGDETVLGDFNDTSFSYNGITSRFHRRNGRFYVTTDNADGELEEFEIGYTFGVYPLQQYLVDFPNGRKQVLSIIWDTRSADEGGQRWYHLYPEHQSLAHGGMALDPVDSEDPLHWTGSAFNWNSRCASCHSTNLERGYDRNEDRYRTTWSEISVGCEACHGSAERHVNWARGKDGKGAAHKGFAFTLADRGVWSAVEALAGKGAGSTLIRSGPSADRQKRQCASCHARRSELKLADPREDFYDTHMLRLLEAPLYYPDGQIRDEVYVWGSFLQSKMHGEGVTCSNCHNPHSLRLKAEGNGVCTQCHSAEVFDRKSHHRHQAATEGAQCVNCHMPATLYMGVDTRRDHSLRIPRPAQSAAVGAPDACTRCHNDKTPDWAQRAIDDRPGRSAREPRRHPFADAFHGADQGEPEVATQLLKIALDPSLPAIARGSAILRHAPYHSGESLVALQRLLGDSESLVRLGALRSMESLPIDIRYRLLAPRLDEKVVSLQVEIARLLAGVPLERIEPEQANRLRRLFQTFLETASFNAGMPEDQVMLGNFHRERRQYPAAENAFQRALALAPRHEGALLNLADFYRQSGRDAEAGPLLERAVAAAPHSPSSHYALGLFHSRRKDYDAAVDALKTAAGLAPADPRYAYTYALVLEQVDLIPEAIDYLQQWTAREGSQQEVEQVLRKLRRQAR
jgi:predicted CXXCH cytochrome family protein